MKRKLMLLSAFFTAFTLTGINDYAGWESNSTGYYYYDESIDDYAYSTWIQDKGHYYYIGEDGYMLYGWVNVDGYDYYLEESEGSTQGALYVNNVTPDGAMVGADGVRVSNPNEKFIQN